MTKGRRFTLESVRGDARIAIERVDELYLEVTLDGSNLHAVSHVAQDANLSTDLGSYWSELAQHWRGWEGTKEWNSLEGELKLAAEMDRTGHVTLTVSLQHKTPWSWRAELKLILEAGQLVEIAAQTRADP